MNIPAWFVALEPPSLYSSEPIATATTAWKCKLVYLNEGGANFVFRILSDEKGDLPRILQRKLLRLGKNLPHVVSAEEQLQALDTNFTQLFPAENLIQHELISLDVGIPRALNMMLEDLIRPDHRLEDLLPGQAMSGMLVTDMTPGVGEVLLQLKPKWLAQSPNAPPNAKRCRTCAVRAHRASERIRTATDAQESCPLGLVSSNFELRRIAVHAVTTDVLIREYLLGPAQSLLQQLRTCQLDFDRYGVLKTTGTDAIYSLCKAMTLRDCTLFVKRCGNSIDARLGDLDLKHSDKFSRWKKVEANLMAGGWYTNTEHEDHIAIEKVCLLAP